VFSWICLSIGGLISSVSYAYLGDYLNYQITMIVPMIVSVLQFISALFIDRDIDGDA